METIKKYIDKVKNDPELIRYIIIGICTTVVNYIVYALFTRVITLHYMAATVISWTAAVLFAYVANKLYVFHSHTDSKKALAIEFFNFILMRVVSLGAEAALMFVLVSGLHVHDLIAKLFAQVVVIILNYVFSKLYIFKGKKH